MEEIEYLFSKNLQYIGIAGLCVAVVQVMIYQEINKFNGYL